MVVEYFTTKSPNSESGENFDLKGSYLDISFCDKSVLSPRHHTYVFQSYVKIGSICSIDTIILQEKEKEMDKCFNYCIERFNFFHKALKK